MLICPSAKHPDEVLDYTFDWAEALDTDTIASATVNLVRGTATIQDSTTNTTTTVTFWLQGGAPGETVIVSCLIVTAGGRTFEDEMSLNITPIILS